MNCHEFNEWIHHQLDGSPPSPDSEAKAHLAECAQCREMHQAAKLLEFGLHGLPAPKPRLNLSEEIVSNVVQDSKRRISRRSRFAGVAAAAALLIGVPLLAYVAATFSRSDQSAKKHTPVVKGPERQQSPKSEDMANSKAPSLNENWEEAQMAVTSLTGRVVDSTRKQAAYFWPEPPAAGQAPPAKIKTESPLDPAAASLKQAAEPVAAGFDMVAASTQRAFSFFARELPSFTKMKTP